MPSEYDDDAPVAPKILKASRAQQFTGIVLLAAFALFWVAEFLGLRDIARWLF